MRTTSEFELLLRCCRSAFQGGATGACDAISEALDWQRFYRLVRFHRVQGLVWKSVGALGGAAPAEVLRAIAQDAASIAATNRVALSESQALADPLKSEAIDFLFVKGLPLGVLAYGMPWVKAAVDIDLLVDERRLADSVEVLRRCGYRREDCKPEGISALRQWYRFRKDSEWTKSSGPAKIDLHTRLTDNPSIIPTVGIQSPRQSVEVAPNIALPTLAADELFAYLAVHGASSAWFRLKWITDFAALIHGVAAEELERLYLRSQELGAGRAAAQALLLADSIYGSLGQATALKRRLQRDFQNRWLWRIAFRQLAGRPEPREPTSHALGTAAIHYSQFLLLPGPGFKISEFVRQARAALG